MFFIPNIHKYFSLFESCQVHSPYKCSACWDIMESPKKLVEHMGVKHKDDFIEFSCSIFYKSNPRLKGIVIHYDICSKDLTGRGSRMELVRVESQCL